MNGWRGRVGGLTIAILATISVAAGPSEEDAPTLVVSAQDGALLAHVALPAGGRFTLRYRNSVYGSLVDEEFQVMSDGRFRLTALAVDELGVLEEYYRTEQPATRSMPGAARTWRAPPPLPVGERALLVAATDIGRRTLLAEGTTPLELWRLVDDARPTVRIQVDR
jgi:hypothetical protein